MSDGEAIMIESAASPAIPEVISKLQHDHALARNFPTFKTDRFNSSIQAVSMIIQAGEEKGAILEITPLTEFRKYGTKEVILMIYPQYQRQGIGTRVLSLILGDKIPSFFVSSKSNPASTAFFQKQLSLGLVGETDRYRVYSQT